MPAGIAVTGRLVAVDRGQLSVSFGWESCAEFPGRESAVGAKVKERDLRGEAEKPPRCWFRNAPRKPKPTSTTWFEGDEFRVARGTDSSSS